ncbi:hypothetical protein SARC_04342 [Sphaeroforma arctica JP610]|uniref:Extracellular membrane protein CFEM domain-containing protein n=1 Tax=Sphaeroforma arctica JP610 TaxID=667725 RepID=A0A0L0G3I5_9EUKA|nr:hypothetical protein SARC_04342 [Sphaeroforma arctica JP610]KNC83401.1 hypothetical protein SARC_04342 [Sphaeroforma arctica JP610]|eukprot:XP_014157303.1 hypothetical protein SARC_04342 [Sphaeroforma arctica JP610]
MFSQAFLSAAVVALVSASSIAPRQALVSAMAPKLIESIKETLVPCASSDTCLLGCIESTLATEACDDAVNYPTAEDVSACVNDTIDEGLVLAKARV